MSRAARRRAGGFLLLAAWLLCAQAVAAAGVDVQTFAHGDQITVAASADMPVDLRMAWGVISDYEHLAEFIPGMDSSRVLQREGDRLLVEQTGTFGFLFFTQRVEVRLAVVESPPRQIVAHAVAGNLQEMEGRYTLETLPSGQVRLNYSGHLTPCFELPPLIGRMAVRRVLARQFGALVQEILRRDALARGASAAPQ